MQQLVTNLKSKSQILIILKKALSMYEIAYYMFSSYNGMIALFEKYKKELYFSKKCLSKDEIDLIIDYTGFFTFCL